MHIERLTVRRFKSLYSVDVPFQKLTVLTGPNGSGKSNAAAALDFLGETYLYGLEYAVGRVGGIDAMAYRRTRRTTVPVHVGVTVVLGERDIRASLNPRLRRVEFPEAAVVRVRHDFDIRATQAVGDSTFSAGDESLSIEVEHEGRIWPLFELRSRHKGDSRDVQVERVEVPPWLLPLAELTRTRFLADVEINSYAEDSIEAPTELVISGLTAIPLLREYRSAMGRLRVYRLNAHACRRPGLLTPNASLEGDGKNLPGVIERMRRSAQPNARRRRAPYDPFTWRSLLEAMAEIFPGLIDITTANRSSGGLDLQFVEEGVGRPWSAEELSDGTMQYLALMTVMLDRQNPCLVMEEPENTLHSWMLRSFIERVSSQEDRQVVLTTHSPVVLRSVSPEEVLLAWRREGRTSIRPLSVVDPDASRLYREEGVDVFEQYDSGFLQVATPGGGAW